MLIREKSILVRPLLIQLYVMVTLVLDMHLWKLLVGITILHNLVALPILGQFVEILLVVMMIALEYFP